ncbi:hypothetical protein MPNT_80051 [Candidatus Methylacidithermus pantelleriae]|uniref:Uncharacterized protein n=1 Tax=Candidatus Methylacidithermus pantelleriae TaxID=2744239 RepID=A0A8J2BPS1_9BACT|nr:hypothetical protein MPNT_80051 [Candidatus Methylacidithermus pantelleriae]
MILLADGSRRHICQRPRNRVVLGALQSEASQIEGKCFRFFPRVVWIVRGGRQIPLPMGTSMFGGRCPT